MKIVLNNIKVVFPGHQNDGQTMSVSIENGRIAAIQNEGISERADLTIEHSGLLLCPGFFDARVHGVGRGTEHRETPASFARSASNAGFTDVLMLPDTDAPIVDEHDLEAQAARYAPFALDTHFVGGATKDLHGGQMSEIASLHKAGAIALSQGNEPIEDALQLGNLMSYSQQFDMPLINLAMDKSLSKKGLMHEGETSTRLGLPGIPTEAETIALSKQIAMVEYTGARLHVSGISSARGAAMIRAAKDRGLPIKADVHVLNLCFTDEELTSFDTRLKTRIPLRAETDRKALIAALKDGTIDGIVSDHHPWDEESKKLEFDQAAYGASTIETLLPMLLHKCPELSMGELVEMFALRMRKAFGLPIPALEVGKEAKLTLIDPAHEWRYDAQTSHSLSIYNPMFGQALTGKALGTIVGEQYNVHPLLTQ